MTKLLPICGTAGCSYEDHQVTFDYTGKKERRFWLTMLFISGVIMGAALAI